MFFSYSIKELDRPIFESFIQISPGQNGIWIWDDPFWPKNDGEGGPEFFILKSLHAQTIFWTIHWFTLWKDQIKWQIQQQKSPSSHMEGFKKKLYGVCTNDKWKYKAKKSSIFHYDQVSYTCITQILCVKHALKQQFDFIYLLMILYSFVAHDEELDAKFQAYQVDLLSKICDHVGWNAQPDEPHVTNLLRYA